MMSEVKLKVKNLIGSHAAWEEQAKELLLEVEKEKKNGIVELDFKGVKLISTAFIHALMGFNIEPINLYKIAQIKWDSVTQEYNNPKLKELYKLIGR